MTNLTSKTDLISDDQLRVLIRGFEDRRKLNNPEDLQMLAAFRELLGSRLLARRSAHETESEQICEIELPGETHNLRPGVVCIACWNRLMERVLLVEKTVETSVVSADDVRSLRLQWAMSCDHDMSCPSCDALDTALRRLTGDSPEKTIVGRDILHGGAAVMTLHEKAGEDLRMPHVRSLMRGWAMNRNKGVSSLKVEAVKLYREIHGCGLVEAVRACEALVDENGEENHGAD